MRIISPSLLAANFQNIEHDIGILEGMGINRLHLDVMDGHFVPTLTFGPIVVLVSFYQALLYKEDQLIFQVLFENIYCQSI